ncbi:uncharacterized protein N7473_000051 [Penicillium subrubescens]|uniref:uncharacterized protein n=1 Tax=Penicillium subrubescens TaxID=1316194 RepID=UPI002545A21E|nr:uncharacterized protein N7473_000051 [Penicillium subrubescens]KAJ5910748.1 hypothetical protein N7473_000051 [Penicillium subrubescens]
MKLPLMALVAYGAFIASASASYIVKRDDSISCDVNKCIAFYSTGSAQCSSGYKRTHLDVDGYSPGSYCERSCKDSERKSCAARKCTDWENECNNTPQGKGVCKEAIDWCDGPVAMSQLICTDKIMGQPVKYEKDACLPKDKSLDSRSYHKAKPGPGGRFIAVVKDEKRRTVTFSTFASQSTTPTAIAWRKTSRRNTAPASLFSTKTTMTKAGTSSEWIAAISQRLSGRR